MFRETKHGVLNIVPTRKNIGNETFLKNFWKSFNAMGVSIQVYSTKLVHNLNTLHNDKGLNDIRQPRSELNVTTSNRRISLMAPGFVSFSRASELMKLKLK